MKNIRTQEYKQERIITMNKLFSKLYYKTAFIANRKYLDEILKNQKKASRKGAYNKMERAVKKHGISKDEYVSEKYYRLKDADMERLLSTPAINGRVYYVADKYGAPMGDVYSKFLRINAKYGIPLYAFADNNLYIEKKASRFKEVKQEVDEGRKKRLAELADITGWEIPVMRQYIRDIYKKYGVDAVYIKEHQLFKMTDEEIAENIKEVKGDEQRRRERIKKENNWTDFDLERSLAYCRYRYAVIPLTVYDNIGCWKYPKEVLDTFAVPGDRLDIKAAYDTVPTDVLDNKILFDQTFKDFIGRKFWINRDTSIEEFKSFIEGLTNVFCKPINLLGGHGSYRYKLTDNIEEMYEYFMNEPKMLIEEIPVQHHLMSEIYSNSINSVRITNVLKDGECIPFIAWVKFGGKGSVVDGRVDGGCFAGVDVKTGIVDSLAIDIDNNRFDKHPDTGKQILGFQIPYWKEVLELTERALRHIDGINFVGWDICITENGPIIIEGNSRPGFSELQLLYNYGNIEHPGQRWRYVDLMEDPDVRRR